MTRYLVKQCFAKQNTALQVKTWHAKFLRWHDFVMPSIVGSADSLGATPLRPLAMANFGFAKDWRIALIMMGQQAHH